MYLAYSLFISSGDLSIFPWIFLFSVLYWLGKEVRNYILQLKITINELGTIVNIYKLHLVGNGYQFFGILPHWVKSNDSFNHSCQNLARKSWVGRTTKKISTNWGTGLDISILWISSCGEISVAWSWKQLLKF